MNGRANLRCVDDKIFLGWFFCAVNSSKCSSWHYQKHLFAGTWNVPSHFELLNVIRGDCENNKDNIVNCHHGNCSREKKEREKSAATAVEKLRNYVIKMGFIFVSCLRGRVWVGGRLWRHEDNLWTANNHKNKVERDYGQWISSHILHSRAQ